MSSAAILPSSLAIPKPTNRSLSSLTISTLPTQFHPRSLSLSIFPSVQPIRMGGGPRTYPGGVSKWQWKRMQAKKAKQLLKARLLRERQIYEMRKRAELKAAVSELEKPWEVVERAPTLFSVSADEQVKALADRFQRPGGFDMWSERDGPQVFRSPDGLPTARFFPKGVVHSVKPYGIVGESDGRDEGEEMRFDDWIARGGGGTRRRRRLKSSSSNSGGRGGSDCIDVEAMDSDRVGEENGRSGTESLNLSRRFDRGMEGQRVRSDSYEGRDGMVSSYDRSKNPSYDSEGNSSKAAGRGRYSSSNRRFRTEKISLRPTTDLYSGEGTNRMGGDLKFQEKSWEKPIDRKR